MDQRRACLVSCELFGQAAERFEAMVVPLWDEVYDSMIAHSSLRLGEKILDVGTGTGEVALRAGRKVGKNGEVVGIDIADEMLGIARSKTRNLGARVKFERMSAESLRFPANTFDAVVGNYSYCCCLDYQAALSESLRVLKPGGRLVYNHSGPGDPIEFQIAMKIFEKYLSKRPSKKLREIREANAFQKAAVDRYRDPFVAINLLRSLGYQAAGATIVQRVIRYVNSEAFVERLLAFTWRNEANEIPTDELSSFKKEATMALSPLHQGEEFTVSDDMVFFMGEKKT